jgi:hypothetical protein
MYLRRTRYIDSYVHILLFEIVLCGRTQETFARKNNEKKNALASTHLICCEPGSQKYNAALKWKLPAVKHEWLLACAREGQRVSEEPYLVGESSCKNNISHSSELYFSNFILAV